MPARDDGLAVQERSEEQGRGIGAPIDVLGYLWSIRRFLPVGALVAALVFGGSVALSRSGDGGDAVATGSVVSITRVETPMAPGAAADAAAAASTLAAVALSPSLLDGLDVPAGLTPEGVRSHVTAYAMGTSVNFLVTGLGTADAKALAGALAGRLVEKGTSLTPMTVGGQEAKVVLTAEPYVTVVATSSRSQIQAYLLAAVLAAGLGLGAAAGLGWWSGRCRAAG